MPRNPFQERIDALNAKDLEATIKGHTYVPHEVVPDDINNIVFPQSNFPPPTFLKAEELSMKDLLDQIQMQTVLNNNIAPFVEKKSSLKLQMKLLRTSKQRMLNQLILPELFKSIDHQMLILR